MPLRDCRQSLPNVRPIRRTRTHRELMFSPDPRRARAAQMLLLGTTLWAVSFPATKAIAEAKVFLSCALVIAGVAVLAGVDWRHFRLGRGELETLAASVLFTGQILWLERPKFAANRANHFSLVMFVSMALVCLPVALAASP